MSNIMPFAASAAASSLNNSISGLFGQNISGSEDAASDPNAISPSFGQTLQKALENVKYLQNKSAEMTQAYATGRTTDIHNVMIVSEQANIALQMATQVRNQVVSAYQEVMRITM